MPSRIPRGWVRAAIAAFAATVCVVSLPRYTSAADVTDLLSSPSPLPVVVPQVTVPSIAPLPTVRLTPLPTVRLTPLPTVRLTPLPTVKLTPLPTLRLSPLPTVKITPLPTLPLPTPTLPVPTPTLPVPTPTLRLPTFSPVPTPSSSPAGGAAAVTTSPSAGVGSAGGGPLLAGGAGSTFAPEGGVSGILGPLASGGTLGLGPLQIGIPFLAIAVPALLLAGIVALQGAVAAAWVPIIRRRLAGNDAIPPTATEDRSDS